MNLTLALPRTGKTCLLCLISLLLNIFAIKTFAQEPYKPQFGPPSPEASALAQHADVPVNLNSGTPTISIPLYTIKERGLTLPISVNYHASGNKVNTHATRVGLGW